MHAKTSAFVKLASLSECAHADGDAVYFDTVVLTPPNGKPASDIVAALESKGLNVRPFADDDSSFGVSFDEATSWSDVFELADALSAVCTGSHLSEADFEASRTAEVSGYGDLVRTSEYMTHPVFHSHRSETQMLRYLASLQEKDVTLRESMIPLGSCTMKLNATSEMIPISWPEFANVHPFAPPSQCEGYIAMIEQLNGWLASIGFHAASTQPNSGATGEYAGLLCIKGYHESRGDMHRDVCLIPQSAHGTNPAGATMCNMKVVGIKTDAEGNVDMEDFVKKAEKHSESSLRL